MIALTAVGWSPEMRCEVRSSVMRIRGDRAPGCSTGIPHYTLCLFLPADAGFDHDGFGCSGTSLPASDHFGVSGASLPVTQLA